MSKRVLEIYIEFDLFDYRNEHFTKWFAGWLYMWGMEPRCTELECDGCKLYRCSEDVAPGVIKVSVESDVNMFDFALLLGFDFVRLMRSCPMRVRVAVCENGECIDMNVKDWRKWYEEDVLGDLGRAGKGGVKIFVHRVCEMCEELDATNIFLTWLSGFIRQNGYRFEVDDERSSDVWIYEVADDIFNVSDVFSFVVEKGWYIIYAAYLVGAYVEVSVCTWDEEECVNLYLNDVRRVERNELPIVGP